MFQSVSHTSTWQMTRGLSAAPLWGWMDWHTCAERLSELKMQTYTIVAGKIALPCNNQRAHPTCTCGPSHCRRTSRWRASAPARALLARLRRLRDAPWLQPSVLAGNAVDCQKLRDRARASASELAGAQHSVRAGTLAPAPSRSPGRARALAAGPVAAGSGRPPPPRSRPHGRRRPRRAGTLHRACGRHARRRRAKIRFKAGAGQRQWHRRRAPSPQRPPHRPPQNARAAGGRGARGLGGRAGWRAPSQSSQHPMLSTSERCDRTLAGYLLSTLGTRSSPSAVAARVPVTSVSLGTCHVL